MAKRKRADEAVDTSNKFEALYNRKKFDVVGKKVKGSSGKRSTSRSTGAEKRRNTLLVELKQSQRANSFIDRRIGENDEGLTADDRAIARFQKQRLKDLAGKRFNLQDAEDTELLPHLDVDTDDLELGGLPGAADSDSDEDLFSRARFGGGEARQGGTAPQGEAAEVPKSKKEIMEEIIAKSKERKAEKAKLKEADTDATEALDRELAHLMQAGALHSLMGGKRRSAGAADDAEAAYDRDRLELVYQAKAKVGDRLKTAEEIAEERGRHAKAEEAKQRQRMTEEAGDAEPATEAAAELPAGGYALRRAKRKRQEPKEMTGDAVGDDFEVDGDDGDGSKGGAEALERSKPSLEERRMQRAAGSHPLQEQFREKAGQLMEKYSLRKSNDDEEGSSEEEDSTAEESFEERNNEEEEEASDASGSPAEDCDTGGRGEQASRGKAAEPGERAKLPGEKTISARREPSMPTAGSKTPQDYEHYCELVSASPSDSLTSRLEQLTSDTAQASAGDRQKIQILYGFFVQHFVNAAGKVPVPMSELDALASHILGMTPRVPLYAATTALARLSRLQQRLALTLSSQDASVSADQRGWPTQRQLLLLKLWATVFPASDRRHPVLTPAALLIASFLALCPVTTTGDVKSGLFLCSLGQHMAAAANRLMPEPLTFAMRLMVTVLGTACPSGLSSWLWPFSVDVQVRWAGEGGPPSPLSLCSQGGGAEGASTWASMLAAAFSVVERSAELYGKIECFPAMATPILTLLSLLEGQGLPQHLEAARQQVAHRVREQLERTERHRKPLKKSRVKQEIKLFNPRFEDDFVSGKDYDPDRDRAEARKLKRMLTKERRGAMRELRKDAAFLGEEHRKEKDAQRSELKRGLQKNTAWLQKLESDFRSGGQGGMWKKKRKK